jgi:hypothetical protein
MLHDTTYNPVVIDDKNHLKVIANQVIADLGSQSTPPSWNMYDAKLVGEDPGDQSAGWANIIYQFFLDLVGKTGDDALPSLGQSMKWAMQFFEDADLLSSMTLPQDQGNYLGMSASVSGDTDHNFEKNVLLYRLINPIHDSTKTELLEAYHKVLRCFGYMVYFDMQNGGDLSSYYTAVANVKGWFPHTNSDFDGAHTVMLYLLTEGLQFYNYNPPSMNEDFSLKKFDACDELFSAMQASLLTGGEFIDGADTFEGAIHYLNTFFERSPLLPPLASQAIIEQAQEGLMDTSSNITTNDGTSKSLADRLSDRFKNLSGDGLNYNNELTAQLAYLFLTKNYSLESWAGSAATQFHSTSNTFITTYKDTFLVQMIYFLVNYFQAIDVNEPQPTSLTPSMGERLAKAVQNLCEGHGGGIPVSYIADITASNRLNNYQSQGMDMRLYDYSILYHAMIFHKFAGTPAESSFTGGVEFDGGRFPNLRFKGWGLPAYPGKGSLQLNNVDGYDLEDYGDLSTDDQILLLLQRRCTPYPNGLSNPPSLDIQEATPLLFNTFCYCTIHSLEAPSDNPDYINAFLPSYGIFGQGPLGNGSIIGYVSTFFPGVLAQIFKSVEYDPSRLAKNTDMSC